MNTYKTAQSHGHLTGLAARLFNQLLTRRFSEAGIQMTAEQWGVILVLLDQGEISQGQLGEALSLEKSTISRSVAGLQTRGWVRCEKAKSDGRQKLVALTPEALEVVEPCSTIAQGVLADAQTGFDPEQLKASQSVLGGIVDNLRQLNKF